MNVSLLIRMMKLTRMKQDQSKRDMYQSYFEKQQKLEKEREIEEYENLQLKLYADDQARRESDIKEQKAKVEAAREEIFNRLAREEQMRRAEKEYTEKLRNELYQEEFEENERRKEEEEAERKMR